jgi:hypothetical protein
VYFFAVINGPVSGHKGIPIPAQVTLPVQVDGSRKMSLPVQLPARPIASPAGIDHAQIVIVQVRRYPGRFYQGMGYKIEHLPSSTCSLHRQSCETSLIL